MSPMTCWPEPTAVPTLAGDVYRVDNEVVELPLLLPRWQASVLEHAARSRGMTTGQMLRRVIADLFPDAPDGAR
jgi:hypothetical protein